MIYLPKPKSQEEPTSYYGTSVLEEFFEHIITSLNLQDLLITTYYSAEPTFDGKTLEADQCIPRLSQENN